MVFQDESSVFKFLRCNVDLTLEWRNIFVEVHGTKLRECWSDEVEMEMGRIFIKALSLAFFIFGFYFILLGMA